MSNTTEDFAVTEIIKLQRAFFHTDVTKDIEYRSQALDKLEYAIKKYEQSICKALYEDLGKSEMESYMTEVGFALSKLAYIKKNFKKWTKSKMVRTPMP